ncbi:MAG: hypothetical protein ITG02_02200 [Patulibacter sp.]|nr:hypothetical protein [Patulibacter sp.]
MPVDPRPTPAAPPTDRVLEMVSPVDKGGQPIDHVLQVADSEDGGVIMQSLGPFADVQNNPGPTFYRARRGATGWETLGMQPRPNADQIPSSLNTPSFVAADARLDALIEITNYPFVPGAFRPGGDAANVYRVGPHGAVDWLSGEVLAPNGELRDADTAAISQDGQRLLLMGSSGNNQRRLYVRDGDRTVEIGFGPGNAPLPGARPAGEANRPLRAETAMSDDGQTVAFNPTNATGSAQTPLYLRRDALRPNASTVVVNRSRRTGDPAGTVCASADRFFGMTRDGGEILLACGSPLTDDAPATGSGVYRYDVATDQLEYQGTVPGTMTELGVAPDLGRIYFLVTSSGTNSLLVFEDGQVREIATDVGSVNVGNGTAALSPDGERFAFKSATGVDGSYGGQQMYVYDATKGTDGTLTCVSCRPGASSGGTATFGTRDTASPAPANSARTSSFSADGRFYFMSTAALTPEAPEGPASVYEFHEGQVRLMAAGTDEGDARFVGVSPQGTDVFVITRQSLLPQDDDAPVPDLYTLRRGGGFPPDPVCVDCTPPAPVDLGGERPGIVPGSLLPVPPTRGPVPPPAPPKGPSTPKPKVVSRRGTGSTVRVRVRTKVAGELRISGSGVRRAHRRVKRAGTYTVKVRLSTLGRRKVERRGRLRLNLRVRLTPERGDARSVRTKLTVKRTTKKGS